MGDGATRLAPHRWPVTYEVNGEQFVVIPAGGHSMYATTMGDSVVAYKLGH